MNMINREMFGTRGVIFSLLILGVLSTVCSSVDKNAKNPNAKERGLEIARIVENYNNGYGTELSNLEMILVQANGDEISRKMSIVLKEREKDGDMSLGEFSYPPDIKGIKLLTWTNKMGDDNQWLYLPSMNKTKMINSKNKMGSFMGSEFSFEDINSWEVEKYSYEYVSDDQFDGRNCWVIKRFPVEMSGYSAQKVWVDKEYKNPVKIEYYDRRGGLLKIGVFKNYQKNQNWWKVGSIHMKNKQTLKESIFSWKSREIGVKVDGDNFQPTSLED